MTYWWRWNVCSPQAVSSLLYDLRSLVNNRDTFPDIVFVVEGKEVYAHKALLCCRSRHFRAMFNSGTVWKAEGGGGWVGTGIPQLTADWVEVVPVSVPHVAFRRFVRSIVQV